MSAAPKLYRHVFVVLFCNGVEIERDATAATEDRARDLMWASLTDEQKDHVEYTELIDVTEPQATA